MSNKPRLFFLLIFFISIALTAQYRFSHLGITQGLSQNSVHCIFQDSQGYLWLGTQDGLNRYDAYTFTTYRHSQSDTTSISDNFITTITEDAAHNLWIGTRNGVNCFNRKTEKFTQIFPEGMDKKFFHNDIQKMFSANNGSTIIFDSRAKIYSASVNAESGTFTIEELKELHFNSSYVVEPDGQIVFADSSGLLSCDPKNNFALKEIFQDTIFHSLSGTVFLFHASISQWWVVADHELLACDLKKKTIFKRIIPAENIHCIQIDAEKNTWIGAENGITILNPQAEVSGTIVSDNESASGLSGNNVLSLYNDKAGEMWVGTAGGGVNLCNSFGNIFIQSRKKNGDEKSISDNELWTVCQDENKLLIGTSAGLDVFSLKSPSFRNCKNFSENISSRILIDHDFYGKKISDVTAIAETEKNIFWIGTRGNGIIVLDTSGKIISQWTNEMKNNGMGLSSNTIFHLMTASDGSIWISTISGLDHFNPETKSFEVFKNDPQNPNSISGNYVISTYEDREKKIWICTNGGLTRYDPLTKENLNFSSKYDDKTSLSYNIVTSCMEDSKGNLWVATLGGGIDLFDWHKQDFKSFTQEQGLANNVVYGIREDAHGDLWMSTNAGISCFHPSTETFVNYFQNDGIISNEYSQNGFFKNKSGEIYFASPEGLMVFDPEKINEIQKNTPVILSGLSINYAGKNPYSISDKKSIDLNWSEKAISFEFAALDFNAPEKINYAYKLEGFDNDWVITNPGQRIATYTSLPFGDYIFKVRTQKNNLEWSTAWLNITVHVNPPFWFSRWFIIGEILAVLLLVISIVRYYSQRQLRIKLRQVEIQRKLQFERERISRDLHDNVGAHLTYIIQSLDTINYRISKNPAEKPAEKIESLGDFARGTMQQLRETIWAINKESISIGELKDKIQDHLAKFSAAADAIGFSVELKDGEGIILKPSQAIHIFRLIQEAINNSIKHSGAGKITVTLNRDVNNFLCITISDNGKGFDPDAGFDGHYGLENMKSRAKELGGELKIDSGKGKGTSVHIKITV